jgi:hypothetical protein
MVYYESLIFLETSFSLDLVAYLISKISSLSTMFCFLVFLSSSIILMISSLKLTSSPSSDYLSS